MRYVLDGAYLAAASVLLPYAWLRRVAGGRRVTELRSKLLGPDIPLPSPGRPRVWFHGVSLGEVNMLASLVRAFRERHPDFECVVSSTTETGLAEARHHFADSPVFPWPLDFSLTVKRAFDRVRPELVVLAEGEIWPNFLREAESRGVPVVVVNARMSPKSLGRYRRLSKLAKPLVLDRVGAWAVQTEEFAANFRELGVPAERLSVTGSVKYDGVITDRSHPKVGELRRLFNLGETDRVWVAGSTHAPEEKVILDAFRRLRVHCPNLRLVLAPRRPERFDEVAALADSWHFSYARRSRLTEPLADRPAVILLDTIGELGAAWGLADVAFTGGSLDGKRGGQSMIEPAGFGAALVFGPDVWNFREPARQLIAAGGAVQVKNSAGVLPAVRKLIDDPIGRQRMGEAARALVLSQQGATGRTLDLLDRVIGEPGEELRRAS